MFYLRRPDAGWLVNVNMWAEETPPPLMLLHVVFYMHTSVCVLRLQQVRWTRDANSVMEPH